MDDSTLQDMIADLKGRQSEIPTVFDAFHLFVEREFPPETHQALLDSTKRLFDGGANPQLPLAPGINLRWGLPDGSQQSWFITIRDDDDPEGKAFFTIRVKPETASMLALWCVHLQRIRVPQTQ